MIANIIAGGLLVSTVIAVLITILSIGAYRPSSRRKWVAYWKAERAKEISQLRLILTETELVRDRNKKAPATDRGSD